MNSVALALELLKSSLCPRVDLGGLWARNKVAHKWKATYRSLVLREGLAWRIQDLLAQSLALHDSQHMLGSRIILRSAFESLAVLIYLNQLTRKVLSGDLTFHTYADKTATLLMGSRDKSTAHEAINIITVLQKADSRYPGIESLYASLSESSHPNYEGVSIGYSDIDRENFVTIFSNKWMNMYGKDHIDLIVLCLEIFTSEYNDEWTQSFELLEQWLVKNDEFLETTKRS